jgi:hypothetical protein
MMNGDIFIDNCSIFSASIRILFEIAPERLLWKNL